MDIEDIRGSDLSATLRSCLNDWGITSLTDIQCQAIDAGVGRGESAIVCAPTSSGKTLVGELAIARGLEGGLRCVYLVSHRALAEQKFADFIDRFPTTKWPGLSVSISTGEHEEGDVNGAILVSTYEKALALLLGGRLKSDESLIVADELQIIGEDGRGSSVETLCTLFRQRKPRQFVGLTATIENPEELAAWMECNVVRSAKRDVDLFQTIRYQGKQNTVRFGDDDGVTTEDAHGRDDLHGMLSRLLSIGLGPVLVFTETRREAAEMAGAYAERCQRQIDGIEISKQLELFSEPTESSERLMAHAERRVTFHTADLTPDEKTVIETGFTASKFDVCFATSTLAAGVNFPFRTVVIPELTYKYGERENKLFSRSDYRNMSGRAGRLGHHKDGRVILMPRNEKELRHANAIVLPENDRVESKLVTLSMRRTLLSLIASRAVQTRPALSDFLEATFYWHQVQDRNPRLLELVRKRAEEAIKWLIENQFAEEADGSLFATPLGRATALSGLLPETAKRFVDLIRQRTDDLLASFREYEIGLLHWVMTCPEFDGDRPSFFLPYPAGHIRPESSSFVSAARRLSPWDRSDEKTTRCVHAVGLFVVGEAERKIRFQTGLSAGQTHRLSLDAAGVLDGLACVSAASDVGCPQVLTNQIGMLARRARWGVPVEALDTLRIAVRSRVPGFGLQRVMALIANGLATVMDVLSAKREQLSKLLGGDRRAESLVAALSDTFDGAAVSFERTHLQLADDLGVRGLVSACYTALGTEYEDSITKLLRQETSWTVDKLDDGRRQNVPDIQLSIGSIVLLIECKTVTRKPPLVAKEEAFAVLQKATDFAQLMRRVTLGKPDFDEHCKIKAMASAEVTLVKHAVFMEGLLRVLTGRLGASEFARWLGTPGNTDLARLPGTPTYVPR